MNERKQGSSATAAREYTANDAGRDEQPQMLSAVIGALTYALDLTEGQPPGHALRSCLLAMRIAREYGLDLSARDHLYFGTLIKDAGCSSNASRMYHIVRADEIVAKRDVKTIDWTRTGIDSLRYALEHVAVGQPLMTRARAIVSSALTRESDSRELIQIRCERGAQIARALGFGEDVASTVHDLDEHWDGRGYPRGKAGEEIHLLARIACLAQTLDAFYMTDGPERAIDVARRWSGTWFDPELVKSACSVHTRGALWGSLESTHLVEALEQLEPVGHEMPCTEVQLDSVCQAFSEIVDAKSPFTYRHSEGVTKAAVGISRHMGLPREQVVLIRRAALLHDIGKLGVPNTILEKNGAPTEAEWATIRQHPQHTYDILQRIPQFEALAKVAAAHHERLDGSGYYRGLGGKELNLPMRILCVADVFDALAADRPYREGMPLETVFAILEKDTPKLLDGDCVRAMREVASAPRAAGADLGHLAGALNPSQAEADRLSHVL